jgi:hypothetical protein
MAPSGRVTVVEHVTDLPCPPAVAFEAVNSPEIAPVIDPAVRVWRPDRSPIGVGTRFTIRGRMGWFPIRGTSEAVTWEPPNLSEFRSVSVTWPVRIHARHHFQDTGASTTRYTWRMTFIEVSPLGRPLVAFATRRFRRAMAEQSVALAAYVGATPTP